MPFLRLIVRALYWSFRILESTCPSVATYRAEGDLLCTKGSQRELGAQRKKAGILAWRANKGPMEKGASKAGLET